MSNAIPPKTFDRNAHGLLENSAVPYVYNEDGSVNWRKMIKPEFLVPNRQRTSETDITKLEDNQLLMLLGGIKELAQLRGFSKVEYKNVAASPNYFAATCKITWLPNYETGGREIEFESIADATIDNASGFGINFLATVAENRAFVRCVRNFLRINIVGQDEVAKGKGKEEPTTSAPSKTGTKPQDQLRELMEEKGVSFEKVKASLIKHGHENAESYASVDDLDSRTVLEVIGRINKASKKKTTKGGEDSPENSD